jgi:hypothetical protein
VDEGTVMKKVTLRYSGWLRCDGHDEGRSSNCNKGEIKQFAKSVFRTKRWYS